MHDVLLLLLRSCAAAAASWHRERCPFYGYANVP